MYKYCQMCNLKILMRSVAQFFPSYSQINCMIPTCSSVASKKLAFHYILQNIEHRKRSLYLQEIISLGKIDEVWIKTLHLFLNAPLKIIPLQKFNNN